MDGQNIPQKKCTGPCGRTLDATTEYFSKKNAGLFPTCKDCKREYDKQRYADPEVRDRIAKHNKRYYSNPEAQERIKENQKQRYAKPEIRQRHLEQKKQYNAKPEIRKQKREYDKQHYAETGARVMERYHSDPEVRKRYCAHVRNRNARKRSVQGTHTAEQIQDQLKRQKYRCYYAACGHAKFEKRKGKHIYHVEHTYPLSRVAGTDIPANSIDYLVLACPACNRSKHDKFPWEFPEGGRLL